MIEDSFELMNKIPGAFFIVEKSSYKFAFVSDGLLNLFGQSETVFLEKYFGSFEMFIYKDDRKKTLELIESQLSFSDTCEANFRVKSILDDEKFFLFQGRRVVENNGKEYIYGLLFEVTEMVVSSREINRMNQDLYQKSAEEMKKQAALSDKARLDEMTGLLNKTTIIESVEEYLKDAPVDSKHALFMIDSDNFKGVNDTYGHAVGDEVIKYLANVIKRTFRDSDFKGRFGGDEFMVFMKNTTKEATEVRAKQLNEAIRKPYVKDDVEIKISCSIGVSYFPKDGKNFDILFANADEALYKAKALGKDRFVEYKKEV